MATPSIEQLDNDIKNASNKLAFLECCRASMKLSETFRRIKASVLKYRIPRDAMEARVREEDLNDLEAKLRSVLGMIDRLNDSPNVKKHAVALQESK